MTSILVRGMAAALAMILAGGLIGCGTDGGRSADASPDGMMPGLDAAMPDGSAPDGAVPDGATPDGSTPDAGPVVVMPPGSACDCDAECEGDAATPGICVFGVCMNQASATCAEAGSTAECPMGSRCWGLADRELSICWPDCDTFSCAGACDADGSCVANDTTTCDAACGSYCPEPAAPCSASAPTGACAAASEACVDGACTAVCAPAALTGYCPPGSACTDGACVSASGCPPWQCTGATCTDHILVPAPDSPTSAEARAAGFYRAHQERYSYLRRDISRLLAYAACETAIRYPGTPALGTGDLSQADGETPGADTGSLRHPAGTHEGSDMDLAYYQTDGANNPQIICGDGSDTNGNGRLGTYNDGYYCSTDTNIVDIPRQAYFLAKMGNHPGVRVFGVDRTLAAALQTELGRLRDAGEITTAEYNGGRSLGYDDAGVTVDDPEYRGWAFHHHHAHLSFE